MFKNFKLHSYLKAFTSFELHALGSFKQSYRRVYQLSQRTLELVGLHKCYLAWTINFTMHSNTTHSHISTLCICYNNIMQDIKGPGSVLWPIFHLKLYFLVQYTSTSMASVSLLIKVHYIAFMWYFSHFLKSWIQELYFEKKS
jgi:hypothetical protein